MNMNEAEFNFDLGSDPTGEDFDPFEPDSEPETVADNIPEEVVQQPEVVVPQQGEADSRKITKEPTPDGFADKPPVFVYAGAMEAINDASVTFEELRIEKSADFPELEDGKRVSWTVEYGKISKTVADPKGTSIGKIKSDIETSKAFEDSLKKRGADKNPACHIKPRVTAQSKGLAAYRGVFTSLEEAEAAGKAISILPGRDGLVYELRKNEIGTFITPIAGCELLSDVRAGFIPALPLIPMGMVMKILAFFRHYMRGGSEQEALVNLYWDKDTREYVVDVPEQTVTKVSVESTAQPDFADERFIHVMDIHSHNSMNASFSPIDDRDEKATRLYTVIGHLDKYFPDIQTRLSNGGKFWNIEPSEVFEMVASPFPDEWKDRIHL
jgi:PRTRC genetic system protein A